MKEQTVIKILQERIAELELEKAYAIAEIVELKEENIEMKEAIESKDS